MMRFSRRSSTTRKTRRGSVHTDGEGLGRADGTGVEGRADPARNPVEPDQPGRSFDRSRGRQPRRVDRPPSGCGGAGLSPVPHASRPGTLSRGLRRGKEERRRVRGPVLPQPVPAAPADAIRAERSSRRCSPACSSATTCARPPGPAGGRSGNPGRLPEAGRDLARRRGSATTPLGLWFVNPGDRKRITSAVCAWPGRPAGSSPYNGCFLNTLGVAQYRCGLLAEAGDPDAVKRPERGGRTPDLAFLALAQHRLGLSDQARTTLGRLAR